MNSHYKRIPLDQFVEDMKKSGLDVIMQSAEVEHECSGGVVTDVHLTIRCRVMGIAETAADATVAYNRAMKTLGK